LRNYEKNNSPMTKKELQKRAKKQYQQAYHAKSELPLG